MLKRITNQTNQTKYMKPENTMQQDVAEYVTILSNSPRGDLFALKQLWDKYGRDTVTPEIELQTSAYDAEVRAYKLQECISVNGHNMKPHPYSSAVHQCEFCGKLKDINSTI